MAYMTLEFIHYRYVKPIIFIMKKSKENTHKALLALMLIALSTMTPFACCEDAESDNILGVYPSKADIIEGHHIALVGACWIIGVFALIQILVLILYNPKD
jgi:hypothetical protein